MDHELIELARTLISSSSPKSMAEDLKLLGSLEHVTRKSFQLQVATFSTPTQTTSSAVPAAFSRPAHVTPFAPHAAYGSNKQEYKPALKDQSLVDALMAFHKSNIRHVSNRPISDAVSPRSSGFLPTPPPKVQFTTKNDSFRRSPGMFQTILRPKTS